MKKTFVLTLVFLSTLVNAVSAAQWWIPAAAHADGAQNSVWRTDVVLHNFGTSTETVTVALLPQNRDNGSTDLSEQVTVAPGETRTIEDILDSTFGFTGTAALVLEAADDTLIITSRTYNLGPEGSFGQSIPAMPTEAVTAGATYRLLGLSGTGGRRTNVGWLTLSEDAVPVMVRLYSSQGELLAERTFSRPFGLWQNQVELFSSLGVAPVDDCWAEIRSDGPVIPYASVVASGSNDPIFVTPMTALSTDSTLLFPAAAHVAGAAGTSWRSDVWILNVGSQPAEITLEFRPQGGTDVRTVTLENMLDPGHQAVLDDVVSQVFGLDSSQGSLVVRSDGPLLATSRTYNTAPEGTFGQFIPARPEAEFAGIGEPVILADVSWNDQFRSNIGVVSTADNARVRFVLRAPSGAETAEATRNLSAGEQRQYSVTSLFGVSSADLGSIVEATLENADEGGRLAAYVSVVDNGTSDPTYGEAWRTLDGTPDAEAISSTLISTSYALSAAVEKTGPQAFKTTVDCIDVEYDGDTVRPGQPVEGKCWIADLTFNQCEWTFPTIGWALAQDGFASADICIVDGRENLFTADLISTVEDLATGETTNTTLEALMTIVMEFDNSVPQATTLIGDAVVTVDGDTFRAAADLMWEEALVGFQFIPFGTLALEFPYDTGSGIATAHVVANFDGTEWVLIESRTGYRFVKFYVNIYTGEIRFV